jgi:radical SAM superfamily enzyme YgiQ (UPF0313 family)
MYLSAAIKETGIECKILDFESVVFSEKTLIKFIKEYNPNIIGLTAFTCTVNSAGYLAKIIRSHFKNIVTVLGGVHVSSLPVESIREFDVDYIFIGEGEDSFPEFLHALQDGDDSDINIPGVCYKREDGSLKVNSPAIIEDLDNIAFPDRQFETNYGIGVKGLKSRREIKYAEILTSRGCPFNCTFCAVSVIHGGKKLHQKKVRLRSVENIAEELSLLQYQHGISHLDIIDSTFTVNRKRLLQIVETIGSLGLSYNCNAIINSVNYETLSAMAETGCQKISFGIESGSPEILNKINKKIKYEQIIEKIAEARRANIPIIECSYIIGVHPDETEDDIKQTEKLMHKLDADISVVSIGIPFPGTVMHEQFREADLLGYASDWDSFSFYGAKPKTRTKTIPNEKLLRLQKRMLRRFYFTPKRIIKNLKKIRSFGQLVNNLKAALNLS